MRSVFVFLLVCGGLLLFISPTSGIKEGNPNDPDSCWKQIDSLENEGLYRSALQKTRDLYQWSLQNNTPDHELKSIIYQIRYIRELNEEGEIEAIRFLDPLLEDPRPVMKSLKHSIHGELLNRFFLRYRWNISQNDDIELQIGDDLMKWSPETFFQHISNDYNTSLAFPDYLLQVSSAGFQEILKGELSDTLFFPTLFDLLSRRALDFVENSTDFHIANEGIIKRNQAETFVNNWLLSVIDRGSSLALLEPKLSQIRFEYAKSSRADKDSVFVKSLKELRLQYEGDSLEARIDIELTRFHFDRGMQFEINGRDTALLKWDLRKALDYATLGAKHSSTRSGKACAALANQIIHPGFQAFSEDNQPADEPFPISLDYRNLNRLWISVIEYDPQDWYQRFNGLDLKQKLDELRNCKVSFQSDIELPDDGDMNFHRLSYIMPAHSSGFYLVIFTSQPIGKESLKGMFQVLPVQITSAFWIRHSEVDGSAAFLITDRKTGKPIQNARITPWFQSYDYQQSRSIYVQGGTLVTDVEGYARIRQETLRSGNRGYQPFRLEIKLPKKRASWSHEVFSPDYRTIGRPVSTGFRWFSDRKIYQPGQPFFFRAILLDLFQDSIALHPPETVDVTLQDPRYEVIGRLTLTTDSLGVCSGEFQLPVNRLTGIYRLNSKYGEYTFQVEHYKRPTFSIHIDTDKNMYQAGDSVFFRGKVMALTGEPLGGAEVRFIAEESKLWNEFIFIDEGKNTTSENGEYQLGWRFPLDGAWINNIDRSYRIRVECSDIQGETHFASVNLSVGKPRISVSCSLPEYLEVQDSIHINFNLNLQDGRPGQLPMKVMLGRIDGHHREMVQSLLPEPDRFIYTKQEWLKILPMHPYRNEMRASLWTMDELVYSQILKVDSAESIAFNMGQGWKQGWYRVIIKPADSSVSGDYEKTIYLVDSKKPKLLTGPDVMLMVDDHDKNPGDQVRIKLLVSRKMNVLLDVSGRDGILFRKWVRAGVNPVCQILEVTSDWKDGVQVAAVSVASNRFFNRYERINVIQQSEPILITGLTDMGDAEPGSKMKLRLQLTKNDLPVDNSSIGLVVYDASLDQIRANNWSVPRLHLDRGPLSLFQASTSITNSLEWSGFPLIDVTVPSYDPLDINWFGYGSYGFGSGGIMETAMARPMVKTAARTGEPETVSPDTGNSDSYPPEASETVESTDSNVGFMLRKDFRETALFAPDLHPDKNGVVEVEFTVPEVFTEWKVMALAHDPSVSFGYASGNFKSRKDLMLRENFAKQVWSGDTLLLAAKATWTGNGAADIQTKLHIYSGTGSSWSFPAQISKVQPLQSASLEWEWVVPSFNKVSFELESQSIKVTDGLIDTLYISSDTVSQWNSHPFYLSTSGKKIWQGKVAPGRHAIELISNPIWEVFKSLPVITQVEKECSEYWFTRFYIAAITAAVGNRYPSVVKWYLNTPYDEILKTQGFEGDPEHRLAHGSDEASPFYSSKEDEMARIDQLRQWLDPKTCSRELLYSFDKLLALQLPDGTWPWFKGMPSDIFITQLILHGLGELKNYQVADVQKSQQGEYLIRKSIETLDKWMSREFRDLLARDSSLSGRRQLSSLMIHYLYTRTFYPGIPIEPSNEIAYLHYLERLELEWQLQPVVLQVYMALTSWQLGKYPLYNRILASLGERMISGSDGELFFPRQGREAWWAYWDILVQSRLIELYGLDEGHENQVESMRLYLLKQKRGRDWGNGLHAALASKALLMTTDEAKINIAHAEANLGVEKLNNVRISTGSMKPEGYYHYEWTTEGNSVQPIDVRFVDGDMLWGTVHSLEKTSVNDLHQKDGELIVNRRIYVQNSTGIWQELSASEKISTGTRIQIHLSVMASQDFSYVRLEDFLGSGFVPVAFTSGFRYNRDVSYYQAREKNSLVFYVPLLTRGEHRIIHEIVVEQGGKIFGGYCRVQCMYAPEFSAWSSSQRLLVGK